MTYREFYTNVARNAITAEDIAFAKDAIAKLDERNAKRNSQPSKKALENEPILKTIVEYLSENAGKTAPEIASVCGISTQKASSLCVQLVKNGSLTSAEIKVPKKGKMKAYTVVVE